MRKLCTRNGTKVGNAMIDAFEVYAQEYDDWFDRHEAVYQAELAAVKSLFPPTGRGVEIGAGTGRFAGPLGIRLGVEPARAMALRARARGIQIIQGVAEALPLAGASVDVVLMVTVLCFLPDPLQALGEATRILRPRGHLVIGLIDPASPLGRSYEAGKGTSRFYRRANFHPVGRVLDWLGQLGYPPPQACQTIFQDPPAVQGSEPVRPGYGEGAFVVLAAKSP